MNPSAVTDSNLLNCQYDVTLATKQRFSLQKAYFAVLRGHYGSD